MINGIIKAVAKALNAEFNADSDAYEIYDEEIRQGLKEPAFFIQSLNPSTELFLDKRYRKKVHILIQYFPASEDYQSECNEIGEKLYWVAELITCSGDDKPIRGSNMHYETVDRVLNFFVDYDFFILKVEGTEDMGTLELNQKAKG